MDGDPVLSVLSTLHGLLRKGFPEEAGVKELSGTEIGSGNLGQEIHLCRGPAVERSSCADSWVGCRCR